MIKRLLKYTPFFIAVVILFVQIFPQLVNPIFPGDSGTRLLNAHHIMTGLADRVWLPVLQIQVFLLYHLKAPLILYKLLSIGYYMLLLFILNNFALRIIGYGIKENLFTSVLLLSLVNNGILIFLGSNLYQEIPTFTLLYLLIYIYFYKKNKRNLFYLISIAAMLTREYFWVYYLAFGLVSLRRAQTLTKIKVIMYCLYGFIPIFWLFITKQPAYIGTIVNNSRLDTGVLIDRIKRLFVVFSANSLVPITVCLILVFCLVYIWKRDKKIRNKNKMFTDYHFFSLLSLLGIFSYIIFRDPWQSTPYNSRMIVPFIIPISLWILICYKEIILFPKLLRTATTTLIIIGVIILFNNRPSIKDRLQVRRASFYEEISTNLTEYKKLHNKNLPKIGIFGIDYWNQYVPFFSGPLVYENKEYLLNTSQHIQNYDIIIASNDYSDNHFNKNKRIKITDRFSADIWFRK